MFPYFVFGLPAIFLFVTTVLMLQRTKRLHAESRRETAGRASGAATDAIGQLTGGAPDFNNLHRHVTISKRATRPRFVRHRQGPALPVDRRAARAQRAATLTRRLLAFLGSSPQSQGANVSKLLLGATICSRGIGNRSRRWSAPAAYGRSIPAPPSWRPQSSISRSCARCDAGWRQADHRSAQFLSDDEWRASTCGPANISRSRPAIPAPA